MFVDRIYLLVHPLYNLWPAVMLDKSELGFRLTTRVSKYSTEYDPVRFQKVISGIYGNLIANMALDKNTAFVLVKANEETMLRLKREFNTYLKKQNIPVKISDKLLSDFDKLAKYALDSQEEFIKFVKRSFRNKKELLIVDEYIYDSGLKETPMKRLLGRMGVQVDKNTKIFSFGEVTTSSVKNNLVAMGNLLSIPENRQFIIESATEQLNSRLKKQVVKRKPESKAFKVVKDERRLARQRKPL